MDANFPRFGPAHLTVLLAQPLLAWMLARIALRNPAIRNSIRWALGLSLLATEIGWFLVLLLHYRVPGKWLLPLQLSDASILLTVLVVLLRSQRIFDIVFYWGLTAVPLAMLMPDILEPFPDPFTMVFFAVHGLVVVILLFLVWGGEYRPSEKSARNSFVALNVFMIGVLGVNFALGTNYMYLMRKPSQPSLLDYFGPWPIYILSGEVVAIILFWLLWRLFRPASKVFPTGYTDPVQDSGD